MLQREPVVRHAIVEHVAVVGLAVAGQCGWFAEQAWKLSAASTKSVWIMSVLGSGAQGNEKGHPVWIGQN